jgi:putative ABC transport system permease protein
MRWWELIRQALAGAARARLRSTLTALGVAIGCGALVSMMAFALGLQRQIEAPLLKLGIINDIHVWARGDGDGDRPVLDAAAIARMGALPGVKYAYPSMSLHNVQVTHAEHSLTATAMALPRVIGGVGEYRELLVAGRFFSLDDAPEVMVAESLLEDLGFDSAEAALDQTVDVSSSGLRATGEQNQFEYRRTTLPVRIIGVFRPPDFGGIGPRQIRDSMLMPVDVLEQLPGHVAEELRRLRRGGPSALDYYSRVTVRAENPAQATRVAEEIRKMGFGAATVLSDLEDMRVAFLFIESLLMAVGSVALVIAGLGIANTLLMTVLERYEEIGLYKAIGATDGDVRLMFVAEAAVLGLAGGLGGLMLAAGVCWSLQWGVNYYLAREGVERVADVFYFPWWLLASGVGFSVALSVLSGLYPASRAARVDPIKALRRA